jgi:hypothetical protein
MIMANLNAHSILARGHKEVKKYLPKTNLFSQAIYSANAQLCFDSNRINI